DLSPMAAELNRIATLVKRPQCCSAILTSRCQPCSGGTEHAIANSATVPDTPKGEVVHPLRETCPRSSDGVPLKSEIVLEATAKAGCRQKPTEVPVEAAEGEEKQPSVDDVNPQARQRLIIDHSADEGCPSLLRKRNVASILKRQQVV